MHVKRLKVLVESLDIFVNYEPDVNVYGSMDGGSVMVQEENFNQITSEDKKRLEDLGWKQSGVFRWSFR